ncbi:MAG: ATP-binding protein [Thermomicrobiales bacterium]
MATITLLCGLPCAGKTTLAKQLERDRPALRLSEDDWVCRLYHPVEPHHDDRRLAIKEVQWDIAVRAVQLGADVVLDWGMWTRAERDDFRARAAAQEVGFELRYLEAPLDELVQRALARNGALPPHSFAVTEAELRLWAREFEPPAPDELG